jgi:hypothetical protein
VVEEGVDGPLECGDSSPLSWGLRGLAGAEERVVFGPQIRQRHAGTRAESDVLLKVQNAGQEHANARLKSESNRQII